jgi:hypothetical protein
LASSIPYLQLESLIPNRQCLDFEINADCSHVSILEVILAESGDKVGFADSAVSYDDYFY